MFLLPVSLISWVLKFVDRKSTKSLVHALVISRRMPFSIGRYLHDFWYIFLKIQKSHFIGQISQMALNHESIFEVIYR